MPVSRRKALRRLAAAGAGMALAPAIIRGQAKAITVAGRPVEIAIVPISRSTVRISVRPIVNGKPLRAVNRGALVAAADQQVASGDLVVRVTEGPSTVIAITRNGRPVQQLTLDQDGSTVVFRDRRRADLRARRRRAAVRSPRHDVSITQRAGRLSAPHAWRTRADPVAGQRRRLGHVYPPAARIVRSDRRRRPVHAVERGAAARRVRRRLGRSEDDHRRVLTHHGLTRSCRRSGRSATCSRIAR